MAIAMGPTHASDPRGPQLDFDDGGPGWRDYDLAVFLWSARAFGPARRALWQPFLDGYRTQRPIAYPELDAVRVFIPIRHIWLMGEYAIGSTGWGTQWLAAWFDRQIEFLRNWEAEQLDCPLRLDTSPVPSSFGLAV